MIRRLLEPDPARLQHIAESMSDANLAYLHNCVEFWLSIRPDCGVKDWLDFSVRRSTNRVGTGTLGEVLPNLNDDDILWLNENRGRLSHPA